MSPIGLCTQCLEPHGNKEWMSMDTQADFWSTLWDVPKHHEGPLPTGEKLQESTAWYIKYRDEKEEKKFRCHRRHHLPHNTRRVRHESPSQTGQSQPSVSSTQTNIHTHCQGKAMNWTFPILKGIKKSRCASLCICCYICRSRTRWVISPSRYWIQIARWRNFVNESEPDRNNRYTQIPY